MRRSARTREPSLPFTRPNSSHQRLHEPGERCQLFLEKQTCFYVVRKGPALTYSAAEAIDAISSRRLPLFGSSPSQARNHARPNRVSATTREVGLRRIGVCRPSRNKEN